MRMLILAGLIGLAGLAACGDDDNDDNNGGGGSDATGRVQVGITTDAGGGPVTGPLLVETYTDTAGNTLVLDSAFVVLRKIHLVGSTETGCDDADTTGTVDDYDGCDVIDGGPVLVTLPLDGSVQRQFTMTVDTGTFGSVQVQLHKPAGANDQQFLQDHPGYEGVSLRVTGNYNGTPYVYTTAATDVQTLMLSPPLVVPGDSTVGLTLRMDMAGWFRTTGTGVLVDPTTAMGAGANSTMVQQNIIGSLHGYQQH